MIQIICTVIAAVVSPTLTLLLSSFFKNWQERRRQSKEMEKFCLEMREFKLLALKCVITNKELSYQARLDAYDKYKEAGGNSWVDGYANQYLKNIEG
jgi:hypothetical protein